MKRYSLPFLLPFLFSTPLLADIENGESLHDANCISCHARMNSDDPDQIYLSKLRKVKNYPQLQSQVKRCAFANNYSWFDEDLEDVSQYLNQQFYHFKQD